MSTATEEMRSAYATGRWLFGDPRIGRPFELHPNQAYVSLRAQAYSGATPRQIRYWDYIGLVRPSYQDTEGTPGRPRLYAADDLERLATIVERLWRGETLHQIRKTMPHQPPRRPRPRPAKPKSAPSPTVTEIPIDPEDQRRLLEARERMRQEYESGVRVRRVGA